MHRLSCSVALWDLSGPGIEPVSPELAGGFLTTVPPGSPAYLTLDLRFLNGTVFTYFSFCIYSFFTDGSFHISGRSLFVEGVSTN